MTANNQQGMTDETIKQGWEEFSITPEMVRLKNLLWDGSTDSDNAINKAIELSYAAGVASQEAEIKRLKEENQKRIEEVADEIIRILNDSDIYYTKLVQIEAYAESLKKRVKGDGT